MARKNINFLLITFILTLFSGVIFFYLSGKSELSSQENLKHRSVKNKKDLTIRGFRFSGYHEGQKAVTIKATKFSVEKKKIGIFKFAPLKAARFRGVEVDLYLNSIKVTNGVAKPKDIIVKGLFAKETMPFAALKGATSIIFEPVKISVYLDDTSKTQIRASKATLDPRQRRVILRGQILATSASNQLSTERLMIYPEKGIIEINDKFILKTNSERITGEKLTTDFFLNKVES
jgi:hypothetical protein